MAFFHKSTQLTGKGAAGEAGLDTIIFSLPHFQLFTILPYSLETKTELGRWTSHYQHILQPEQVEPH